MAIYEYSCSTCEAVVEFWQSPGHKPPEYCVFCGGKLRKIISKTSFHLKGKSWAKDGYANNQEEKI